MIAAPAGAPPWAHDLAKNIQREIEASQNVPVRLPTYTVANLPKASRWQECWIHVSNETGGAVPAFSDGTNWRRCTDRAVVN